MVKGQGRDMRSFKFKLLGVRGSNYQKKGKKYVKIRPILIQFSKHLHI